jgi:hypothetical protein
LAELFILARMRASFEIVREELEAVERRFALNPAAKLCIGDIGLLPVDGVALFPQDLRERWATELERGLFNDLAIGTICGTAYGAAHTNCIDRYKRETYTYGNNARIVYQRWTSSEGSHEVSEDEFLRAKMAEKDEQGAARDDDWDYDDLSPRPQHWEWVDAKFKTDGIRRWFQERQTLAEPAGVGAKLVIINTRDPYSKYEDGDSGRKLLQLLGQTATNVMRGEYVACIAVRTSEQSHELFQRIRPALKPRLVEDFLMFDIGQDVAALRPGFSKLEQWTDRFIIRREVVEPDAIFRPTRKAS